MTFAFKKTNELTEAEIGQINELFASAFLPERNADQFRAQFLRTPLGYSYHGLMTDEGRIVGAYSSVPYRYRFDGRELLFALTVDTMVAEAYRGDPWQLMRLAAPVYEAARKDGLPFAFCFPNDAIYEVRKRLMRWHDVGRLSYYALPLSLKAKSPALGFMDPALRGAMSLMLRGAASEKGLSSEPAPAFLVEKITDAAFRDYRYRFFYRYSDRGTGYRQVETPAGHFVYRMETFERIDAAFLMDVYPLTKRHLAHAVSRLFQLERGRAALILYVGNVKETPFWFPRLPRAWEPKPLYMMGKILLEGVVDERIYDLSNWCVSLSNYEAM